MIAITTFPGSIQTFPTMQDITANDAVKVAQYQAYMELGDTASAQAVLQTISSYNNKIISADFLNTLADTNTALQLYYLQKFSPAYVVSDTQPASQDTGDFWFEITG